MTIRFKHAAKIGAGVENGSHSSPQSTRRRAGLSSTSTRESGSSGSAACSLGGEIDQQFACFVREEDQRSLQPIGWLQLSSANAVIPTMPRPRSLGDRLIHHRQPHQSRWGGAATGEWDEGSDAQSRRYAWSAVMNRPILRDCDLR